VNSTGITGLQKDEEPELGNVIAGFLLSLSYFSKIEYIPGVNSSEPPPREIILKFEKYDGQVTL
jgi:hypothetical protein